MVHLSELETRLAGPDSLRELRTVIARLTTLEHRLALELQRGLPPADFERWQSCLDAVRVARHEFAQRLSDAS